MKITKEVSLEDFEAWSGAKDTLNELTSSECEQLELQFEKLYPDGMDETQVNDILWFERDWVAECLGYKNWEHLERGHNGECTEEHAREVLEERYSCAYNETTELMEQFIDEEWTEEMTDEEIIEGFREFLKEKCPEEEEDE